MYVEYLDNIIAQSIRERRHEAGLSQSECAKAVRVSRNQFQKYEAGQNRISASRLHLLARFMNVDMEDFFEGVECDIHPATINVLEPFAIRDEVLALEPKARRALRTVVRVLRDHR